MKQYNHILIGGAITIATLASCADNSALDFAVSQPDSLANVNYLSQYDELKTYVDRSATPDFKLGAAISANDYIAKGGVYVLSNSNFDEVTAGNAMKYASVVANDGMMNFSTVKKFVAAAKEANTTIYGHTLAWHSQQNNQYLNSLVPSAERYLHINIPEAKANAWDWEFYYNLDTPLTVGKNYTISFKAKASEGYSMPFWPGDGTGTQYLSSFGITGTWKVVSVSFTATLPLTTMRFELGQFCGDLYLDDATLVEDGTTTNLIENSTFDGNDISKYSKPSWQSFTLEVQGVAGVSQTPEEKKAVLTTAMDTWIAGMMSACEGYVTAWDVVNEPLSGADLDGDGIYDLQSATRGTVSEADAKNNFYWQDYMGDLDYVRTAVSSARKNFAENGGDASKLKLFINDYNLESDWDNNMKVKSLVKWIEKWEADGTTKIDGIGTQMHVSYYLNPATQKSKESHIVEMFKIMAATGKLVRISELDMGIVDANGNAVNTSKATASMLKGQADFYEFIVKAYLDNVPAAQRYGICQWCITDSPSTENTWRKNEPVGLWTLDMNRKPAYAGFANGLAGKIVVPAE